MISPLSRGAVVGDSSLTAVAKNTAAFQACLGFAILSPGNGELWVQNRTGFTVDFTYHVIGPPAD